MNTGHEEKKTQALLKVWLFRFENGRLILYADNKTFVCFLFPLVFFLFGEKKWNPPLSCTLLLLVLAGFLLRREESYGSLGFSSFFFTFQLIA